MILWFLIETVHPKSLYRKHLWDFRRLSIWQASHNGMPIKLGVSPLVVTTYVAGGRPPVLSTPLAGGRPPARFCQPPCAATMYPVGGLSLREIEGVLHYLLLSLDSSSSTAQPIGNTRHRASIYISVSFIFISLSVARVATTTCDIVVTGNPNRGDIKHPCCRVAFFGGYLVAVTQSVGSFLNRSPLHCGYITLWVSDFYIKSKIHFLYFLKNSCVVAIVYLLGFKCRCLLVRLQVPLFTC